MRGMMNMMSARASKRYFLLLAACHHETSNCVEIGFQTYRTRHLSTVDSYFVVAHVPVDLIKRMWDPGAGEGL
jgi:hypothetical protein